LWRWWALLLIGIVSLPVGSATGQTARLLVPTDTVQIGERFHVVLIVERPATATARIPDPALGDTVLGDLELLRVERRSRGLADGSGLARDSMRYEVTTFALDTAFVPPLEVHLLSDRDTLVVRTAPYLIPARSVVPAAGVGGWNGRVSACLEGSALLDAWRRAGLCARVAPPEGIAEAGPRRAGCGCVGRLSTGVGRVLGGFV